MGNCDVSGTNLQGGFDREIAVVLYAGGGLYCRSLSRPNKEVPRY